MLDKEIIERLKQPLDKTRVKHRQGGGGMSLAYIPGYDAIDRANELFGYGQWGYDLISNELVNVIGESGEILGGYYAARVRLTVAGCVPITEEGVCPIQAARNPRAQIDAHDMARKGAVTDAMKRALRIYGDQFGNSLYDTDLVDGQPGTEKVSAPYSQNRPTTSTKPLVTQNQPNPTSTRPAPRPTPDMPPQQRAVTQEQPIEAPAKVEMVTDKEIALIMQVAGSKGLDEIELAKRAVKLYGRPVDKLDLNEARNFYRTLQEVK